MTRPAEARGPRDRPATGPRPGVPGLDAARPSMPSCAAVTPAPEQTPIQVVAAVVWREGRLLFTQRPPSGPHGLKWEFPGGKLEPGETPERALAREIAEELGVQATPLERLASERHDYPHGVSVEIQFLRCALGSWAFVPNHAVRAVRWWRPEEVPLEQVLEGDRGFLESLGAKRR